MIRDYYILEDLEHGYATTPRKSHIIEKEKLYLSICVLTPARPEPTPFVRAKMKIR